MSSLTDEIKKFQLIVISCLIVTIGVITSAYYWRSNQLKAKLYPVKRDHFYPFVPYMSAVSEDRNFSNLMNFVVSYIELTKNKNITQFKRGLTEKTKNVATSNDLLLATMLSKGEEKKRVMKDYFNSGQVFNEIKDGGLSWRFNIDAIESVLMLPRGQVVVVTVIGEYQVDEGDPNKKSDLWGYRRIALKIIQGPKVEDTKGNEINKDGYLVIDSEEYPISTEEYNELNEQSYRISHEVK